MSKNPTPNVRPAGWAEEEELMDLLRLNAAEEHPEIAPDDDRIRAVLQRGLSQQMALVGIIRGRQAIEGTVGIYVSSWWFSGAHHCDALWLYVHPDHRRTTHIKSLFSYAKWAADELGFPLLHGVWRSEKTAGKDSFFERFAPVGGRFFMHQAEVVGR